MKHTNLIKLAVLTGTLVVGTSITSCGSKEKIGILQPVDHPALNLAKEGFVEALKEEGFGEDQIEFRNAKGDSADQNTFAKNLADSCKLVLGIGTGAAQSLQGAITLASRDIPLLFTAVTDPVDAGLVTSAANQEGNACGTTDANPVEEQINLIKDILPSADKIGIIYTQTETNSKVQADQASLAAKEKGLAVEILTCKDATDISITAEALASKDGLDAIYVPTDNNIAANMNAIETAAEAHNVLVVCGEENMLTTGGHVSISIDYKNLGFSTGKMAAQILKGKKKSTDFPVTKVPASDCAFVLNSKNLASAQITIPESVMSAHTWKDLK